ncbi:hypothetical protein KCU65_g4735, partial [Aureobasidium melanogenum]
MSTNPKIFTNAHEILANDLLTSHKIQMKELKTKHKKKKATLLKEIQTANTRHRKLKSELQKDVRRLKKKLAKHRSKYDYDLNATTSLNNGVDLDLDNIANTDGNATRFDDVSATFVEDDCSLLYESETVKMQSVVSELSDGKREARQSRWEVRRSKHKNNEECEEKLEVGWNEEITVNEL